MSGGDVQRELDRLREGPLRLAYLTYRGKPHVGGQGVYTRHLTKALVDLGHHVEVYGGQPYPVLDSRIALHKLPSLDIFNDQYPGRFPAYWELNNWPNALEALYFLKGTFAEPLTFSLRAYRALRERTADFDLVHDNQCLGKHILSIEKIIPTIVTLHHPITKDRKLEMAHTKTMWKRLGISRWYSFVKMQGKVASRLPRIVVVSENSINDIHTDMGVSLDRMRLVPVGVDPDLFKPLPDVQRKPHHLITTASADVALKGLAYLLEAVAKLRTERDVHLTIIGKPRAGASADLIESLGLRERKNVDLIACPSCGRAEIDVIEVAKRAQDAFADKQLPLQIAVMGCVVNGPGEAREADLGIAAGNKRGHLFVKGRNVAVVPESEMVEALVDWATFIHEHGVDAALARVDTTIAEREAARDRSALLDEKGDDANRSSEKIVEIRKTLDG